MRASCIALLAAACAGAHAQDYPSKPLRYIVPFGAGGPTDTQARWAAQKLNAALGQTVIVDSRPAVGGLLGTAAAAKSPADGYTLLAGNPGPLTVAPAITANMPFDTLRDFTPVILIAKSASALVVHPAMPAKNLKDFVALAKVRPGKLNYENYNWNAVLVPAKTPAAIIGKLHGVLAAAIRDNRDMFVGQGQEPGGESGEHLVAFIRTETERYEKVAREAQIPKQ